MPCPQPCGNCQSQGLPILFTRYAAAYSARQAGMDSLRAIQPSEALSAQPGGVPMRTAVYGVRMLREGYLYVLVERVGLMPEWHGYAIDAHGYLSAFDIRQPTLAQPNPACEVEMRGAAKSMVWITDAKRVKGLWYLFHPDPIQYGRLTRVIQNQRGTHLHKLDVAAWLKGTTTQKHALTPDRLGSQVLEFAALDDTSLQQVGNEQYYGLMGRTPQERHWGDYEIVRHGRRFGETAGGAAIGPLVGPYTETVRQVPYHVAHGPRLKNIAGFLAQSHGVIAVCDDALGIAQELSLHHLTAAEPYMHWLQQADARGVSNQWKQAASESIKTVRLALARRALAAYDDQTDRLRDIQDTMSEGYPGSDSHRPVRLRRPDGSEEEISLQELNRRRVAALQDTVASRESDRSVAGVQAANQDALNQTRRYCDMEALSRFDALHLQQIRKRDERMDQLSADLHAWLKADAFIEGALGCYDEEADIDTGDGARCAGQLCAILLQLDSAPRGRAWYAALDLFTPGKKNLVWRMLSLNNAQISAELQSALALLTTALPVGGLEVRDAEERARLVQTFGAFADALSKLGKTLSAADKIGRGVPKVLDSGLKRFDRLQALGELAKVAYDSPHAVLGVAAMAHFKTLPPASGEQMIAKSQLLLLARGLGTQAVAFTKQLEAEALGSAAARQARYTQRSLDAAIRQQISAAVGKDMRLATVLLGVNALGILPALAKAYVRRDERTSTELVGALAGLIGGVRQWRADLYEKGIYRRSAELVHKTQALSMDKSTETELLRLKAGAAYFVAAGAVVGVAWDVVDAVGAVRDGSNLLGYAYFGRAVTGAGSVAAIVKGAGYIDVPLWLTRTNFYLLIATGTLSFVIGRIKGKAWANWLQAQPFRAALIQEDGPPLRVEHRSFQPMLENTRRLYQSESEMMAKLAEVLSEMDGGE